MKRKFLKWGSFYKSELGESTYVHKILPKKLSFTKDLPDVFFENCFRLTCRTVFNEVSMVPFTNARKEEEEFFADLFKTTNERKDHKAVFKCLVDIIRDVWSSEKFHLIMHSSGYESRLISSAIKKVYEEEGKSWLGDVLFIVMKTEDREFKEIMQYQGWKKDQYTVYENDKPADEYFERSFEFSNAWERLNGWTAYPVNLWWEPVEWAQELNLVPGDDQLQCWAGYGRNELAKDLPNVNLYRWKQYHRPMFSTPMKGGNWILPFYSFDYIQAMIKYGIRDSLSVLKNFDPVLTKMKRSVGAERTITTKFLSKVVDDYQRSFYGKMFPDVKPTVKISYSKWWGVWCLASLCEHLLSEGYELS